MIEECGHLAEELGRNEPRPAEVCVHLNSIYSCGAPNIRNYNHLQQTKVLDRLAGGIATALGFHPNAVPEPDELREAIEGCKDILHRSLNSCGKFQEVIEGEDEFAYYVQGIFVDNTFDYSSDRNSVEGDSDQEEHANMLNHMEHEERYYHSL